MIIDCHNHTEFSMDGKFSIVKMLNAAIKNNIDVFAITDHCDVDCYEEFDLKNTVPNSIKAIANARASSPIKLLTGIELGQPLKNLDKANYILDNYKFDYIIGSIHSINNESDFYFMNYANMSDCEIENILERYYKEVYELANWNKFDSLAHITYPYRYIINAMSKREIKINVDKYDELVKESFIKIIENGKAIENNTYSFTRSKQDFDINYKYMKLYYDLGGELITIGSDAHTPDMVGNSILKGYDMLKEIGFKYITYFENRKAVMVKI